jgi:isoleucyl-tRNA synthetase
MAPFTPFLAEELYMKLTGGESVHLNEWPKKGYIETQMIEDMARLRFYINECLAIRSRAGIKVRQPLGKVTIPKVSDLINFDSILKEELNVKAVVIDDNAKSVTLDLEITHDLKLEGILREVIRLVQSCRKEAGFEVDDRINMYIKSDSKDINDAIDTHRSALELETLSKLNHESVDGFSKTAKIDEAELLLRISKV